MAGEAVSMKSLRVSAALDASEYTKGAAAIADANQRMSAGTRMVSVALGETESKVGQAGGNIERLSRQFVTGYSGEQKFVAGLRDINRALETGKIELSRAEQLYAGMSAKLGLAAAESTLFASGYSKIGGVVANVNAELARNTRLADEAAASMKRLDAVNDNMTARPSAGALAARRQNLMFQANDIGVSLAGGMNPLMVAAQQGSQIMGIYGGQGGVNAALSDSLSLVGRLAKGFGPVGIAAGAAALSINSMQDDIEKITGRTVGFGEVAKGVFKTVGSDIMGELKPAIDAVSPLFATAWDKASTGAIDAGNLIINSFHAAYTDVMFVWNQFPTAMEALFASVSNLAKTTTADIANSIADSLNPLLDTLERRMTGMIGPHSPIFGQIPKAIPPITQNPAADDLEKANAAHEAEVKRILGSDPIRGYYRSVRDRVAGDLKYALPDGGANGKIPIPGFRGVDDAPPQDEFLRDFQQQSEVRRRQMEAERDAIGLTGRALDEFRFKQDALLDAYRAGVDQNPAVIAAIDAQAKAYAALPLSKSKASISDNLIFEGA